MDLDSPSDGLTYVTLVMILKLIVTMVIYHVRVLAGIMV